MISTEVGIGFADQAEVPIENSKDTKINTVNFSNTDAEYVKTALTIFVNEPNGIHTSKSTGKMEFIDAVIYMIEMNYIHTSHPIYDELSSIYVPEWIKSYTELWLKGKISDDDFLESTTYLLEQNIIRIPTKNDLQRDAEPTVSGNLKIVDIVCVPSPSIGGLDAKAIVKNIGSYTYEVVDVTFYLYDASDEVLDIDESYIFDLRPGETDFTEIWFSNSRNVDSCRATVQDGL